MGHPGQSGPCEICDKYKWDRIVGGVARCHRCHGYHDRNGEECPESVWQDEKRSRALTNHHKCVNCEVLVEIYGDTCEFCRQDEERREMYRKERRQQKRLAAKRRREVERMRV